MKNTKVTTMIQNIVWLGSKNFQNAIIFLLLFNAAGAVYAFDGFFVGIGNGVTGNTHLGVAASVEVSFGMEFNRYLSAGLKGSYHNDLDLITSIEPRLLLRYSLGAGDIRPFIQVETGGVIVLIDTDIYYGISAGLTAGSRFMLARRLYIEPTLRMGYPFLWGAGFTVGMQFQRTRNKERIDG